MTSSSLVFGSLEGGIKMATNLDSFLKELNEENNEEMVNIVKGLFDLIMFDEDGEFRFWQKSEVEDYGGMDKVEKDLKKVKKYLGEHGIYSRKKLFYFIYSVGEDDEVDTEKELEEVIEMIKEFEDL